MKKLLAILLSVAMLVSVFALTATAAETNTKTPVAGYSESLVEKLTPERIAGMSVITSYRKRKRSFSRYRRRC